MTNATLFQPTQMGSVPSKNHIVMAPLTRSRALPDGDVAHALHAEYYSQRASAGLIITEATQISPEGKCYITTPGIYSDAQIAGWKLTTDAVHVEGGKIFAQFWHVGGVSHTSLLPNGQSWALTTADQRVALETEISRAQVVIFRALRVGPVRSE